MFTFENSKTGERISLGSCMKDPGPCSKCGKQTSMMYALFSEGKVVNGKYESGRRVTEPLCQNHVWARGAQFILIGEENTP